MKKFEQEPMSKQDTLDIEAAVFQTRLEKAQMPDEEKQELIEQFDNILESIIMGEENNVYKDYVKNRERKNFYRILLGFILGVIVALIPTLVYMNMFKTNIPPFKFAPNVLVQDKEPIKLEKIDTQEKLELVKTANIRNKRDLKLGSYMSVNPSEGIIVFHISEHSTLKPTTPQPTSIKSGKYIFTPDTVIYREPRMLELITSTRQLEIAKNDKQLREDSSVEIGAAIAPDGEGGYYAIPKEKIKTAFIVTDLFDLLNKK